LLAQYLGVDGVAGVKEPAVDDEPAIGGRERAKGHHGGVGRGGGPLRQADLLGRAGRGLRDHALGDQVEDAGAGQVAIQCGVEGGLQYRGLGIKADGLEVGGSDADAVVAEVSAGVDPVLGAQLGGRKAKQEKCKKMINRGMRFHAFHRSFREQALEWWI
jgi:hypothetical protein